MDENGERIEKLTASLVRFYSVMGHRPEEPGALAMMAEMLCQSGTDDQIALAMTRCSKECRFPVRLPDFLQRIPGGEVSQFEAEMRASWDVLVKYVSKWGRWGEDYLHAYIEPEAPTLPPRIVDSVRRTGGWGAYLQLSYNTDQRARDANFQQQRYYEEYKAWTAVEHRLVDLSKVLQLPEAKRPLLCKPLSEIPEINQPAEPAEIVKSVPPLPTERELSERQMTMQQSARAFAERKAGRKISDLEWEESKRKAVHVVCGLSQEAKA